MPSLGDLPDLPGASVVPGAPGHLAPASTGGVESDGQAVTDLPAA